MNVFDFLSSIIYRKPINPFVDDEDLHEFNGFLLQRWLSMYSSTFAKIVNCSTNFLWKGLENKEQWYQILSVMIPRSPIRKIPYIKKNKEKRKQQIDKNIVKLLANNLELSEREVSTYIKDACINVKQLKKQLGIESNE